MKTSRILISVIGLALTGTMSGTAQAQFNYITTNGTMTITGYTGPGGDVTIPSAIDGLPVNTISYGAFQSCATLTSVSIPDSVTSIGGAAFFGCTALTQITLGTNITNIGGGAFNHTALTSITIPSSVTSIGSDALAFCSQLTNITVHPSNGFYMSVGGVLFNKDQTTLFLYPGGLAGGYTVPNSVTNIGLNAFQECTKLTSVTIPDSVTSIGGLAFYECTGLTSVRIGNGVTGIGSFAFHGCSSLTDLTIGIGVTTLGEDAFSHCTSLTNLTIPDNVTNVGDYAFACCTSLTNVMIGKNLSSLRWRVFNSCGNLISLTVDALNTVYSSIDGVLFNKSQSTLVQYPAGKAGSYTIPNSVSSIGIYAFYICARLTSISIPNSVTNIGDYAFGFCASLTTVTLPNGLSCTAGGAFYECTGLTNVTIPNSVTNIQDYSFGHCTNLINVIIPSSVTRIGNQAFDGCKGLKGVYFLGNAPSLGGWYVFEGCTNATVYYLPGTTGWGTRFGTRPTALWQPQLQTSDVSFGVQTNQFVFKVIWASGKFIVVEASTTLANPAWTPVSTNTLVDGWSDFRDTEWQNHPARFYRVRSP